ncbi:Myosin light chain kinase, smooth muscle [Camponotus floridanus]|uniref:Myosin light chain kinase, smooth muscle n=1 Tax=Camponotus floridanus TaxID=104421 RepID=E2ARB0_CAMFO|nr:Myosin light chain kinase, smooth muscle [Camponotus floridanus]
MTLTDLTRKKGPPEWVEEDQTVSTQGRVGEDIIVELKLVPPENSDDLQFDLIRDGLPIPSDRYRLSMRGNVVQLALKQSRKNDAGYYSLVATRLGQENDKGAVKKIHLSISEASYEEGDPPIFLRRLSDLAVKVGTRTRFLVEIRSSTTPKISWYKDDSPIHEGPRFSLVHEGNFHCVDVAPVTVEDQGCWTCMAENRSGRSSCTSTLTVIVPKAYKRPEFVEELRALLTETGTVSLECKVVGVPTPVLRWFKDSKEIKAGDVFALTANADDPTSLGVYTCEANNCMGTTYSSSKVHVVGRGSREGSLKPADTLAPSGPLPVFKQMLQDECCRIGDTLVLSCRAQVPPWPKAIAWYNKGGRVEPDERYHIIEDGIGGYSIEVKQVEAMDEGEWKCVATSEENMKQFTSCYVAMSIPRNYRKPRFMENLKAVLTEEGLVSFECKVVGFPTPLLRWFKDGQELKPGDVYQLTGTNSLGSYCCIAKNCMGEAKSTAELTIEDIQNQLNEEERFQLLSTNQPPKFIKGLRSCEARINEDFRFTVQVSVAPQPSLSWYRDDTLMEESDKYHGAKENLGTCHLEVRKLEFIDQAEWKCVAANDFGHSVTSCFLKLIIPKHYKKPKFLESLRAILSEEGAVNLECKVIGVPQPVLKWYKDNVELKPGDIHRIISGQDGTCCLGTYTCEATNCMGTVSSSASLLGFEDKKETKEIQSPNGHELARNLSLSTIHEERTSQLYDTPQTDHSVTFDERGEVSFSFDGKEVSVSLYETPDLTEEEALQIVEMYADQLSEHVTEHNVIELPPMRFVKETSTSGNLLMEAVVIDVSPDYFVSAEEGDDLRTEADFEDVSIMDDVTHVLSSLDSRSSLKRSARYADEEVPSRPPRKKSTSISSSKSEKSLRIESETFHSAQKDEAPLSPLSSLKQDDSDTFADALSSAHLSITESLVQKHITSEHDVADTRKRSLSTGRSTGSSLDDGISADSSFDSMTGIPKKKHRKKKKKDKSNSEDYSGHSDYEDRKSGKSEDRADVKIKQYQSTESADAKEMDIGNGISQESIKKSFSEEKPLDNLTSVTEAVNVHTLEESRKLKKDILLESRTILRKTLETYEKVPDTLVPRFSSIRERVNDVCQTLEISQEKGMEIETLIDLEVPLHALLKTIDKITSAEDMEIIRNFLEPSIRQLSHVVEGLGLSSLQPTLMILRKINERICNIPIEKEELSSLKSISDETRNISEEILDMLIDIQSAFSAILDYMECSKLAMNGTAASQQALTGSKLAACLVELRECVSHTTHTAMTLKENETLNSLMEFREPLLDLQVILASDEYNFREITILKEIIFAIERLKNVVVTILENSKNSETTSRVKIILQILEDTDKEISKLMEQLLEMEATQKRMLKNLNIDQSLSSVHFALSSVLEQQEKFVSSHHLITCIETLRQTIGSSAVTIANLKNPTDNDITQEIMKLTDSLLNLQKNLLTEKHEPGEEQILNNLINPIDKLKEIIHSIMESDSSIDLIILPMLKLLEEIEKDAILVTKEMSKKKSQEENATKSRKEKKGDSKSILACQISRSLEPIKQWLSTSEDSTKDEIESTLSLTIEELKRDVTQIAIQTSYSEPPDDESLIEALIDLREPLIKLKNAISMYRRPEDFLTLENLGQPMKHLLQIITNVFHEHAEEERLKSMVEIVEQIENEISLSIKDTLYQQELEQSVQTFNVEEKEDIITVSSQETIPGTLTEIASTPFETGSLALPTEQLIIEDNLKITVDDIASQVIKAEKQEREKNAGKLITVLSETLEKLQLEMTNILEDFEESATRTATIPQSKLANFVEELRRTTSTIRMITSVYDKEIGSLDEKVNQTIVMLTNLTQPLTNIQELLSRPREHDISELMILNRLTPLLNVIETNVIKQTIDFVDKNEDTEKEFEFLLHVLQDIKAEIPIVIQEISSRQKALECLRDVSKPLDSIVERMNDLQKAAEGTLETDVANILGKPIAALLKDIKIAIQETGTLDRRGPIIIELRNLLEPLLEFHSCLSMVQSSRQSLVPEGYLLEERRSVILQAVGDLRKQVCHTVETIANMEEASLFDESLMLLNSAIQQVQKKIGKTDYSRRSSSVKVPLQHRLTGTLSRLANAIAAVEEHADRDTYGILSKCLEALHKQISFTQVQFIQIGSESIDEEAIIEGFLYPTNQLLSALNVLKENTQKVPSAISRNLIIQFQELADSISELNSSLAAHKAELVQEGASTGAPIIETFSAVTDVLSHVKDSIMAIEKTVEQKESITKVESIADEIIELSQEEIESVITITEIPSSAVQDVAQSKIEDTPKITQTPVIENVETATRIEQTEDNLVDTKKYEENQEENEKQKYLKTEMSKFNSTISSLAQPLKELISFVESATQESLVSKSEENKRKIQELTALVQILYDLQATNISVKTALSSPSIILIDSKFSRMKDNVANFEQAIGTVISLTDAGVKPELKENIITSLQSIVEPLNALENTLVSICQTFDGDKYVDQNGKSLPIIAKDLIPCINDTIKSVNAIQVLKSVKIADERETEISKIKEEINDIEETTARPLEELIEAIMDSQDQVKCDKTSPYESSSPSADPIESKSIDNLSIEETELNETFIKETNDLIAQDAVEILQQELTSAPVFSQIEEILAEKEATIKSATESLEEIEEKNLETINQQKIELTQVSEKDATQEKQIKVETLHAIISPLQVLRESFNKIEDVGTLESSDNKMIAFSTLIEPLLNLEVALSSEITEEIKQDTVSLEKLSITCVLQELQNSIATIQEQVQLNTATEASSSKTAKIRLLQAIEKPLEDLKMSIACIQSDPITCQLIQQKEELSSVKQITILQTLAKSVEQFGDKFMAITNELKIEESESPLQIIKQKDQELDPEILHKIVEPIHILRETLSQIEELKSHKTELLEIPEQKREIIQLNTVINPLEKLEQLLSTNIQQITPISMAQEKALGGNQISLTSADLKPVLEELKDSIVIQQQAVSNEDSPTVKTLNETFENLKTPLTIIQEIIDCFDEITETEKLSTLLMFAKSVEETTNQLVIAKQNIMQQEMRETSLLKAITIPIEGLQSAILKFEDRLSQTLETKESIKLVALESMVQPLQELQQSFLIASHQEIVQSLQRLPIKPILDSLNKSVAVIQNQATIVQDLLTEASTDDLAMLKDFAKSLGNLRTSTVVLQQLNAIENAGQQIVEIENASALQAFAKSIEEFRKCCSIVIEKPRIIEAFAKSTIELKQSAKTDAQLLENIIAPLRILQEQILTIEETKMQESEVLDITEIKKPVTVLSSLVGPLQQLEKSFVATVCKEHVIEHDGQNLATESPSTSLEKLALQPILEEVQKSIATVQEHVILEAGQIISEAETDALLKSIAQPLVDLRASIASIQQVTTIAPDPLNELAQQQNISALESFAETLHNLSECIAMCNHQQIIMEPVADTFSEGASSLNTWADVIDEQSLSKVTQPMVIDQVAIESPIEVATSISDDEASALKTLAKPLIELRECLALVIEERKIVAPSDTTSSLSERENVSLLKTMIQPLLELKDAATAVIIQEQTVIERANEHSFAIDGKNEFALRPLMEPLEELRHSIAVIEDQMLVETSIDQPQNEIVLDALAEPLLDLQRAISVLEARVISPDVESLPEDTSNSWITECLAVPLHEIERSIADIRQCTIIEPEKISVKEEIETSIPWSIVEELSKPMENIKSAILRMEDDYTETEILKTMVQSLTNVQEKLMLLKNKHLSAVEESSIDAIVDSLFNFEKCISFVKKEIVDKPMSESSIKIDTAISAALNVPLNDLKYSIVTVKDSPSIYLKDLQRPLELVQDAFETIISIQQNNKLLNLSTKCITQIPEKPKETANLMISTLQNLEKSVAVIQQQSADKPLADPQHANFGILSKNLILCLHELQESMEEAKALWHKQTILEGLIILEEPICKLQSIINIISDQFLAEEMIQIIEKQKIASQKKSAKKEVKKSETIIEKDDEINKTIKVEIEETKLTDTADSTVTNDMADKEEKKNLEIKQKQEKEDEKSIKEKLEQPKDIVKKGKEKEEEYKKIEKQQECKKEADEMKSRNEEQKKEEIEKINKEQKSKEIEQVTKEVEQNKSIKDERIKKDEKEHKITQETESLKKHEDGKVKQIEKQEKVNATESIKDEIQESKKIIETEKIKSEKNEQQNKENYEEINKMAEKQEQETVQKRKESDKSKKIEKDLNVKEETGKIKLEEAKDIERKKVQAKEKEKADEIKKEQELKDIKEKVKEATEQYDKKNEIEKLQKKETDEIDKTQQKEQEHVRIEKTEIVEKDHKIEVKEIKKQEEDKTIKKDGKEQEKEDEKAKRIKTEKLEKEEQIKKEEDEKLKDEKTKEMKKKKEDSNKKDEIVQEKLKQQEQTPEEVEAIKTKQDQKEKEITEKVKEKGDKKAKDDVEELETKEEKSTKIEKLKEKKQKEEAKVKTSKKEDEQKQITETEKVKVAENEAETKKDMQEDKKEITQKKDIQQDKKVEEEREERKIEERKEEQKETTETEKVKIVENQAETKKDIQEDEKKITQKKDKQQDKKIEKKKDEEIEERKEEQKQTIETEKIKAAESQAETKKDIQEDKKKITQKKEKQQDKKIEKEKENQIEERKEEQKQATQIEKVKVPENQAETKKDMQEDKKTTTQKKDKQEDEKIEKEKEGQIEERKEEQKQTIQIEKIKVEESQAETKDMQEDKKQIIEKKDKQKDKKVEKEREEQIEKRKEEIIKIDQVVQQTQNEYIKKENDEAKGNQKYKEAKKELEETTRIKQKQEEKLNKEIQKSREDKDLHIKVDKYQKRQRDDEILQKREEQSKWQCAEMEKTKRNVEQRQWRSQDDEDWLRTRKEERFNRSNEYRLDTERKEQYDRQKRDDNKRLHQLEIERLEKKFAVGRSKRDETDYMSRADEERLQKRSDEKRIRGDETARLLWEEGQKLRKKQEEEAIRNIQRRKEQIRESEWSRRRENESDRFLKNMLETRYKPDKSVSMFFDVDYSRDYTSRLVSGISTLSSTSRSYSWRDSLTSLSRRRIDDYWDYKLHGSSMDKYFDIGSYRRRKRRENRMIRARSTSLLKYEDYSTGDSDATIVPSTRRIRPVRRTKTEASRINFDLYEPSLSSYAGFGQNTYRYSDQKLILECRVRAHPPPSIFWLRDGQVLQGERYKQSYLDDDVYRLEIANPNAADNGRYTCRAVNDLHTEETSHVVHVEDWRSTSRYDLKSSDETGLELTRRPRFSNLLKDYNVPAGGTIALQVEVKGVPAPEIRWLRGDRKEPIAIPKARTFTERGLHTLIVPEATESERGTYVCRAINAYGQVDTSATVDVITSSAIDGGKPAAFVSRPSKKTIDVTVGEDVSISFRVNGTPKPRVIWMKGLTDITDGPRSYKESIDDYVRLTLKRAVPSDEGTYCILVKNRYGCDRSFFSIKVKQRARSLTPSPDWNSVTERDAGEEHDDDMSYVRNVPGPISSEPVAVDGGKNWLSLTWGKAERRGPAPVIAYKVDAWLLGSDGGARWIELGITPINAFDAFNLRPGGEYKFRVTPRNRYGWGEPVTMTNSVLVSESTDLPEFTKILPGQLKALEGTSIRLECEIHGDPKVDVRWYRETTEIDSRSDSRFAIYYNGSKCFLTLANIKENDSGRYVCEASNKIGKVSSFARVLVVNDPRIIEADTKLRTSLRIEPKDKPPQFTMRIRDRRVQTTYPIRLTCQVIGHPAPEITWYKNEEKISQDDRHIFWDDDSNFHTLEITHSTLDDSGCYMVTARNVNGSVSCRCTLVVDKGIRAYVAPEFLRGLDAAYTVHSGRELRMSAQLEAYPSVGVVWHRDGIRLRPNRRVVMTLSHDGTVQFSLANITARDAGVYSCTATNAVGHTETSTRIAVIEDDIPDQSFINEPSNVISVSPDIPYSKEPLFVTKPLSTEAVEGDTVIILCEVVGDPKPEVIWLRDFLKPDYYKDAPHFRLVGAGPQYRLEIPYAKLDFTGTYSVIARNCHGEAKAVISLQIYAKVMTLPIIKRELRDLRCCDGDAVSLECKVYATPEPPLIRWERGGKIISMMGDFAAEFDGETARLSIQHVYPEDEGEYTCVAYNDLGKAYTSACLVVDVPEGKESTLSQRLTRPVGLLSAGSTPRSTPRSTPIRSLSPAVSHGREFRSPQVLPRGGTSSKRPKVCPPKFYAVPHNRLVQEGETVRFQCAVVGHPAPWIRWDKNGTIVTPSTRISIKERDDVKILEIVDVMREDAGLYRVTAENDFGRIEASARLEVISRYESTSRTIRTRSASPRTYPSFDRSLLSTTSRISERLQLECRIRGTPSVTPTWYRNGRPLERSARIKRYFDGTTAKIEISKVKASDAGEYTCVATNVLGSTKSSCQVTVLDPRDSSIADKNAPRFLRSLPEESIIMENHCHEFQAGVTGTPPFTITWFKDGRELPDNDYYRYVIYGDGGVALRLSQVRPQDAGEYTCVVRNDFGVVSCNSLFAVQDYKDAPKLALQFTKTPLSVIAVKGGTACFCARMQCEKTMELVWTINGKDARENAKCKIERDGNVSILRIRDVSSRETGEIRCTVSVNGKGPSISCTAKLQLQRSLHDSIDRSLPSVSVMTKPEDIQSHAQAKLTNNNNAGMSEKITELSLLKRRQGREKSPTRIRSSSFPRRIVSCTKNISPLPAKKRILNNASADNRKSRFENNLSRKITKNLDSNAEMSNDLKLSSSFNEINEVDISIKLLSSKKPEQFYQDTNVVSNEECAKSLVEELMKATIIKDPADIAVFRGNSAVVTATYQGRPEPTVKWLRVNRELQPDEKIKIISGNGTSCLTLDNVTYDHAGKYEVSVENLLGKERRFFSLAVEGPPEPIADKPSVNLSTGQATIVWRSPPYDGGRTVIGYTVEAKHAGENTWMVIAESCHSLSHTVSSAETNLVIPGESYRFRVRAENIHGLSDPSMESDSVRIPKEGETMLQEEEEDEFEPSFAARIVEPEDGKLFGERYNVLEELGKGRYGIVKKVIEQETDMSFAAKFVKTIKAKDREQVREEIKIMNILRHPKLLLLAAAYESPRETILITEYISGGELFERVVADDFTLTERDSILFMRQICQGVEYMHKNKIVHLDLKPENIMCRTRTSHQIKLIDFGLAQTLKSDTPIRVLFGTPEFIPPEIISYEPIGTESDMWSVGVICYVLLTGLSPFMGDNDAETFANITRADYDLEDEAFDAISNNAKDFISGLLIKRKELRMSATQCLEHPWLAQHAATMSRIALPTEKLKKFIIRRKWQKTGNAIRALGRMAILSANSRLSPTATAESSPTLEQRFEMQYSDDRLKSIRTAIDEDTEHVVTDAKENSAETESWTHPTYKMIEINTEIEETPAKEESLSDLSNQVEEKTSKLHIELIPKIQNVTTRLEILASKENEKSDKELIEKSSQMDAIPKSQVLHRVFRGDSRDSGIGDCGSNQMTSSLQMDELEIESTIVEEVDHETHNRESKQTFRKEENQQSSTRITHVASLSQGQKNPLHDSGIIASNDKVVTKSDVTKASCETNPVRKVADESSNARILSGRNHDRFLPTGKVSRTAKIFERESGTSKSDNSQVPQRAYPAALVTGKPHNERIQKAFAFWNK